MRTLSTEMEDPKVRKLIAAARKEPVLVLDDGEPAAVVLSPEAFERLDEADRVRREAIARLRKTISAVQREGAKKWLTKSELERLALDKG
jgi:PHD/YefM family antitoxin component YafN of YafNO toxin-antitoxin module